MKIRSKIDVITNSSTEVFIFKISDPDYTRLLNEHPELKQDFTEFRSLDDIRKVVDSEYYYGGLLEGQSVHGDIPDFYDAYENGVSELLESGVTRDQIWELYKEAYKNLVGISYAEYQTDGYPTNCSKVLNEFLDKLYIEKLEEHLREFKSGDILAIPDHKDYFELPKSSVLVKFLGDFRFDSPWCQDWEDYEKRKDLNLEALHQVFKDGFLIDSSVFLVIVNLMSARKATETEIQLYESKKQN